MNSPRLLLSLTVLFCTTFIIPLNAAESSSAPQNPAPVSASADERYQKARSAFDAGDLKRADEISRELLRDKHFSVALFQLLGHIHFRENDLGQAALWYQRANLFPPPQPEIRQNLSYIHDRTGNVNFSKSAFHRQYSMLLSRTEWFNFFAISAWTFILVWVLGSFIPRRSGFFTLFMFIRVVAGIAAVFMILGWYWHPTYESIKDTVVVTKPDTKAYTAASTTSGSVIVIPAGSDLRVLEERGSWIYVEVPSAEVRADQENVRGWVASDAITQLWPFDPAYLE